MTEVEAASLIAILAAAFPNAKIDARSVSVYVEHIREFPYADGQEAVTGIVRTSEWFPTVAVLRREILSLQGALCPAAEEAWVEVEAGMRKYGRTRRVEWSHPAIGEAVSAMGWTNMCLSENIDVVRGHFFKIYNSVSKRTDRDVQVGNALPVAPQLRTIEAARA